MTPDAASPEDTAEAATPEDEAAVERGREDLRGFVSSLSLDEIRSGGWFSKLLTLSLATYSKKVDATFFRDKYPGVPADAIVDQRIKMAARYAAIEGGLSAGAYTGVIAATIGSAGAASPATVPAAIGTVMVDIAYTSQLQLRLAYDIAMLYRVRLDLDDPDDLWKLIRVAFTIKSGELGRGGATKIVPVLMRPLIRRFFSGSTLTAARALPVVGKFLLQRNLIKIGIPLVGIPLAVLLNRWTTAIAGRHAQVVFRNEARVRETAHRLMDRSKHRSVLLWVAWLVIKSDGKISDDEALLMRFLMTIARERHQIIDEQLERVIDLDSDEIWDRIAEEPGDLGDLVAAAESVARIDGEINAKERKILDELRRRCHTD